MGFGAMGGGRGGRTRTCEWRSQSPMCYRFTTPLRRRPAHGAVSLPTRCVCRLQGKTAGLDIPPIPLFVGWVKGLEPSTPGTTIRCSNQLSYTHHRENGTPEGTRTPGLLLRRQLLYPTELLAHMRWNPQRFSAGAGEGNRTLVSSLEGWCSTIELHPQAQKG